MIRRLIVAMVVMALGAVFVVPGANAAFGIEKWQALTCAENEDTPPLGGTIVGLPPLEQSPGQCTEATEGKWFTQAAGHPTWGITDFTLNTLTGSGAEGFPDGFVKDIIVDTPEGLSVNPEAAPECTLEQIEKTNPVATCPTAIVGTNYLTVAVKAPGPECVPKCPQARRAVPVFNVEPFFGAPSMVAFPTETGPVFIVGSLDPVDQHVTFTISDVHSPLEGGPPLVGSRLVFSGAGGTFGDGTYLTMPSNCGVGQTSILHVDQHADPGNFVEKSFTTKVGADGCDKVPFEPTLDVTVDSATDSPEPVTLDLGIPFDASEPIANSYLKTAKVTLPEGAGINPSLANGLVPCTDAQFKYHTDEPIECPNASIIGTTEVQTPSLPPNSLSGTVYVAQPLSNNPSSGNQFRVFLHVFSERFGVNVRLVGNVFPNLTTGQLTAVVDENPQATFSSFKVHINGGSKGALTTPGACGPHATNAELTPWSGNPPSKTIASSFTLTSLPGGGPCPKTLAERPFAPGYTAKSDNTKGGAYSPFRVHIGRPDGQQELKGVDVTLPEGLTGKLAGVQYCPEAAIAAAAANSGAAEKASSSCPSKSEIGTTSTEAGSGSDPFKIAGKAFLAGPYKGAPISLVTITPAVAGPYDLGTVVVRAALFVNPETTQVRALSDVIPDVFGGVKLDIRSIDVNVDRKKFMRNPTDCGAKSIAGFLNGGGADPTNPATFSSFPISTPFQATGCGKLKFGPRLFTRLLGGHGVTTRGKHPKLRAILEAREGDANLARSALVLPHVLFLDQGNIKTVCTRPQLAARECPKAAVYGHARAKTPLLDNPLKGPVYMVSSTHELPDLVADLRGQVNVQLHGIISSKPGGGIKTVFNPLPDVPVKKFILWMKGGAKQGLLENSTNLCTTPLSSAMNLKAQNGKRVRDNKLPLKVGGCNERRGHHK